MKVNISLKVEESSYDHGRYKHLIMRFINKEGRQIFGLQWQTDTDCDYWYGVRIEDYNTDMYQNFQETSKIMAEIQKVHGKYSVTPDEILEMFDVTMYGQYGSWMDYLPMSFTGRNEYQFLVSDRKERCYYAETEYDAWEAAKNDYSGLTLSRSRMELKTENIAPKCAEINIWQKEPV